MVTAAHNLGLTNHTADYLSRMEDNYDWGFTPLIFQCLDQRWGPHTVDCFASENNHLLLRFNSHWRCPSAKGMDTFSASWAGENNFLCPPFRLIL
jgi:hypothetical protein